MPLNTCEGEHYTCGKTADWPMGSTHQANLTHTRNRRTSFMLGTTEIVVNHVNRTFSQANSGGWVGHSEFLMRNSEGDFFDCGSPVTYNDAHSVSELYECVNTTLYFLDMRYNNALGKEVTEKITFSEASGAMAGFKETWGIFYYPKYVITNHTLTRTTVYFIILNGVKTVLKTETVATTVNGPENPLILVYPQPGSLAIPWINCDDIKIYGFYDYYATGEGEGQSKIQRDGGDDYYFTDWMRGIGTPSREQDQRDADERYFEYYLRDPYTQSQSYSNPGIATDDTPIGSITQDNDGNIFYSLELGGEIFNSLTGGDLVQLFPDLGANARFYPVGII